MLSISAIPGANLPVASKSNNASASRSTQHICDIFAVEPLSQIAKLGGRWLFNTSLDIGDHWIHRKLLVMREREDTDVVDEAGVMYRRSMVDGLMQSVFFVCHSGIINIDKPICRSRQERRIV